MSNDTSSRQDTVIPIVEEVAKVNISDETTGRTRVTVRTEIVEDEIAEQLETHGVNVEYVEIGRDIEPGEAVPIMREEGDVKIFPVLEEVLVVEKRLRLVKEVHIRLTSEKEDVEIPVTRRRQVADVEHETLASDNSKT